VTLPQKKTLAKAYYNNTKRPLFKIPRQTLPPSAEKSIPPLPSRPRHPLDPLLLKDPRQIDLARASSDINRSSALDRSPLPELETNTKQNNNRSSKVSLPERQGLLTSTHIAIPNRPSADPKLCNEYKTVENKPNIRSNDTSLRLERQLVQAATLFLPGGPEADVTQADREPGQDQAEAADGEHPGEGFGLGVVAGRYDEAEQAEGGRDEDADERAAGAVDVAEGFGGLALLGEGGEGAGAGVDGAVTDGEDGDEDHSVHYAGEAGDSGWRGGVSWVPCYIDRMMKFTYHL
jgi:hypothetical protein